VLVVDDEPAMRRILEIMLGQLGHRVVSAADGRQALQCMQDESFDLLLTDLRMPVLDGVGLLQAMRQQGWKVPTIVMTAQGSIESAVQAMKLGALDYLLRPFDVEVLELAIDRVLKSRHLQEENEFLRQAMARPGEGFVGTSAPMQAVMQQIRQVGPTRAAVFISGETGTGKEVAAHAIHQASERAQRLFVPINCAALPAEMVEAELFGHERGAFTGAVKERVGKFELASGGTVFLDEITEMPIGLQAKLLRVLQEGCIERLGGNRRLAIDVRVIAASNRDPRQAIRDGRLREDLYYRLNVFGLALPPLRERPQDLPALVAHLAGRQGRRVSVSDETLAILQAYTWPGNVRELDNVIQRALVLCPGSRIEPAHLPADLVGAVPVALTPWPAHAAAPAHALQGIEQLTLPEAVERLEGYLIERALQLTGDNKRRAAALLDISERALWYKVARQRVAAVTPPDEPSDAPARSPHTP
jgi:two-component system, NtrC family, response regulator AtoC